MTRWGKIDRKTRQIVQVVNAEEKLVLAGDEAKGFEIQEVADTLNAGDFVAAGPPPEPPPQPEPPPEPEPEPEPTDAASKSSRARKK